MRRFAGVVLVLAGALWSCGPTETSSCGPATCGGCCNAEGQCVAGILPDACGFGGAACSPCGATEQCNLGVCRAAPDNLSGACSPGCPAGFSCNQESQCGGGDLENLVVDVKGETTPVTTTYPVTGKVTLNGALPTVDTSYCSQNPTRDIAVVRFYDSQQGQSFSTQIRCDASDFSFSAEVPAGTYDVSVERGTYAGNAGVELSPFSPVILKGVQVSAPRTGLVLNQVGHRISGRITVNGATPERDATYCDQTSNLTRTIAQLRFANTSSGGYAYLTIPCSAAQHQFATVLPEGTYSVQIRRGSYASSAKSNLMNVYYEAEKSFAVSGPRSGVIFNQVGHQVTGRVTVDGAVPTKDDTYCANRSTYDIGVVEFYDSSTGYRVDSYLNCDTTQFEFAELIPAGTYRVNLRRGYYATNAKVNLLGGTVTLLTALDVKGPVDNLVLDQTTLEVSGKITVAGGLPKVDLSKCLSSDTTIAAVHFRDTKSTYSSVEYISCATTDFSFTTRVPPGTYSVDVEGLGVPGVNLAAGRLKVLSSASVAAPVTGLLLDQSSFLVSGKVTLNGRTPTRNADYCSQSANVNKTVAEVRFYDSKAGFTGKALIPCSAADFSFSTHLPAGQYDLSVATGTYFSSAGVGLLGVSYKAQQDVDIQGNTTALVVNEVARAVKGKVTQEGKTPTRDEVYCATSSNLNREIAEVRFSDSKQSYYVDASILCSAKDFTFETLLPSGVYRVRVARGSYGSSAKVSLPSSTYTAVENLLVP